MIQALAAVVDQRGAPQMLRCDNGPEFNSAALQTFCKDITTIGFTPTASTLEKRVHRIVLTTGPVVNA